MRFTGKLFGTLLLLGLAGNAAWAQAADTPVESQARRLMRFFADPTGLEALFSPTFLAQVPAAELRSAFASLGASGGTCTGIVRTKDEGEYAGAFEFHFAKGILLPVHLVVSAQPPHRIEGLFISSPVPLAATLAELVEKLKALPGTASLCIVALGGAQPTPVVEWQADESLAIGSAFKLYVLGELLRQVNRGERAWSDVIALRDDSVSLPGGFLHTWPVGTAMTVESVAALMISISDNTAADNLLRLVGRENVEKLLPVAGNGHAERDIPFLATLEMFKLKGDPSGRRLAAYLAAADRKKFLREEVAAVRREEIVAWSAPSAIDRVEWFASARELCALMDWLRTNSEHGAGGAVARRILAINPGLLVDKAKWSYVGFKGGSEPGVLNLTCLLQSAKGKWYALSCSWNNPAAEVDTMALTGIASRAIQLLEP